ncbi:DUF6318 family protein [Sanguibacter suaedae]|uniref:DUF6318 domain-containing protein n=1 Tax=Sanguibacter suaedae TaxID=2795737 RepID=A0A934M6G7_9MICO|nr:DUF6318 family protein [Sanguibacter suaedae]MBI9114222.1 hypothetical protein [Sanguibacter suaedae]
MTETPDPTPSATPTPPERPAAMDGTDNEAAKAAAEYFLSTYMFTYSSGETDLWKSVSGAECSFCRNVSASVDASAERGERSTGGELTWSGEPVISPVDGTPVIEVSFDVRESEGQVTDSDGATIDRSPAANLSISVFVYRDGDWRIFDVSAGPAE